MLKIEINNPDKFDVDVGEIESAIKEILVKHKVDDVYVSVAVVGETKMRGLVDKHYEKDNEEHPVLSFPNRETRKEWIPQPPQCGARQVRDDKHMQRLEDLGEIILNFEYSKGGDMNDWAAHGALHLIGIHHE